MAASSKSRRKVLFGGPSIPHHDSYETLLDRVREQVELLNTQREADLLRMTASIFPTSNSKNPFKKLKKVEIDVELERNNKKDDEELAEGVISVRYLLEIEKQSGKTFERKLPIYYRRDESKEFDRDHILARTPMDNLDDSTHPSYTNFKIPYEVICRKRYHECKMKYEKQFHRELKIREKYQPSAYQAARLQRIFCFNTLWPPLHTSTEIDFFLRDFLKFTPKEQSRLNYLLRERQI